MVILVLLALLLCGCSSARCQGQLTACKGNLKNIGTAAGMYCADFAGHYPLSLAQLTPNYLRTIPTCPSAGVVTYRYRARANPDIFVAYCSGRHHAKQRTLANFPAYSSPHGLLDGYVPTRPPLRQCREDLRQQGAQRVKREGFAAIDRDFYFARYGNKPEQTLISCLGNHLAEGNMAHFYDAATGYSEWAAEPPPPPAEKPAVAGWRVALSVFALLGVLLFLGRPRLRR